MSTLPAATVPYQFAVFAGASRKNWSELIGQSVTHRKYGIGTVTQVGYDKEKNLRIEISFVADPEGKKNRQFKPEIFAMSSKIRSLTLPNQLELVSKPLRGLVVRRKLTYSHYPGRVPREACCWACQADLVEFSPDVTPQGFPNCHACRWIICDCGACRSPRSKLGGCDEQILRLGSQKYSARLRERFTAAQIASWKRVTSPRSSGDDDGWAESLAYANPPDE